jgi:hypothetical protein
MRSERVARSFARPGGPHRSVLAFDVKKSLQFKIGDRVTVRKLPSALDDPAQIDTPGVFRRALGKTFRVEGIDDHGHLELIVAERRPSPDKYESDTIWIEPQFVALARRSQSKK